jgi:hypothetical protein
MTPANAEFFGTAPLPTVAAATAPADDGYEWFS